MKIGTKVIHAGYVADVETGALMPPIYMTSTYLQDAPGEHRGYDYTRAGNPNFTFLETLLASLENAKHATVFSSGMGALTALLSTLTQGDRVVAIEGLYGGTYRLFNAVFKQLGIDFETIKPTQASLEQAFSKKTEWLLFETPTNPLLNIHDIEALVSITKKHGAKTIVDNTFATPYFQQPLQWSADVSWHSTTKYLGGHSDTVGGVLITNDDLLKQKFDFARKALGLNPSPFDTWLTMRGVKTLAIRMEQHQRNAFAIAAHLLCHPLVAKVHFPGLESHPQHLLARKQMTGFSGMVSVEFKLKEEEAKKLISSFNLFSLAESLGGVESLVCHPSTMTHASIPPEERRKIGLTDGLIRFSVGIEDPADLIADLDQACKKIK